MIITSGDKVYGNPRNVRHTGLKIREYCLNLKICQSATFKKIFFKVSFWKKKILFSKFFRKNLGRFLEIFVQNLSKFSANETLQILLNANIQYKLIFFFLFYIFSNLYALKNATFQNWFSLLWLKNVSSSL